MVDSEQLDFVGGGRPLPENRQKLHYLFSPVLAAAEDHCWKEW
jgi:hypothetical protein